MTFASISNVHAHSLYGGGSTTARNLAKDWSEPISTKLGSLAANRVVVDILKVSQRPADWDDCGSLAPSKVAVACAVNAISTFAHQVSELGLEWLHPHVGSNEIGEISFEWWRGTKKLTLYVGAEQNHYVSSWGLNIDTNMEAGILRLEDFPKQWRWLSQVHN